MRTTRIVHVGDLRRLWVLCSVAWSLVLAFQIPFGSYQHQARTDVGAVTSAYAPDSQGAPSHDEPPLAPVHRGRHSDARQLAPPEAPDVEIATEQPSAVLALADFVIPVVTPAPSPDDRTMSDPVRQSLVRRVLPSRAPPVSLIV